MKQFNLFILLMSMSLVTLCAKAAINDSALKVQWGYKGNQGPARWGALSPEFITCLQGKMQSPINIPKKIIKGDDVLVLNYSPTVLNIVNNGTTQEQIGDQQIVVQEGHGIQVNFAATSNETMMLNGEHYRLLQFHIHTPSENQWHGQSYPLEIHFVHQGEEGKLVVIGVFAMIGDEHGELQKIIDHLPDDQGKAHEFANVNINPLALMPTNQNHYSFLGSLTTPPCTEGVQWIVMDEPITISSSQVVTLKKAVGGINARPVQALNRRKIFYTMTKG